MDTFCVLPWFSQETFKNKSTPCCLLPTSFDLDEIKKDLLRGKQTPACKKCWDIEKKGVQSRRQQENIFLDYKLDRDIEKIKEDCKQGKNSTLLYQIATSNLCNQACVSCGSLASTKWAEIEKRQGKIPNKFWKLNINKEYIDFARAKRISLLGGEPLYDDQTFEILQKLIDHKNTDCFVTFVTNGSVELSSEKKEIMSRFSDLNICVSIDGIEKRFEYMRWPGKWNLLCHNLDVFRSIAKSLSVSYTISSLNALYYQETVSWFNSQQLGFNHNIVSYPTWLSLEAAPTLLRENFPKIDFFESYKKNKKAYDIELYRKEIRSQDLAKKINLQDYMPEVAELIGYNL